MLGSATAILREIDAGTGERELSRRAMADIGCPVIWLAGDRSAQVFAAAARCAIRKNAIITLVSVEGSGHVMQHDRPDAVVGAVRAVEAKVSR